jgi:hypothetical protein
MKGLTLNASIMPYALSRGQEEFFHDVLAGLRACPKRLPCKYFYDARGSQLFDRICELDEYYLTRAELAIMERFAAQMGALMGREAMVVELGSGSSVKTRYLLDALHDPVAYVPIERISPRRFDCLVRSARRGAFRCIFRVRRSAISGRRRPRRYWAASPRAAGRRVDC